MTVRPFFHSFHNFFLFGDFSVSVEGAFLCVLPKSASPSNLHIGAVGIDVPPLLRSASSPITHSHRVVI
ncbi:hypothetical protein I3760_01G057100 [Carya illinoinensis]|nr:hypothetical protein I3760_01G057100 [Carya illinoinensis]